MKCNYCDKLDKIMPYLHNNLKYCVDCRGLFCDLFIGDPFVCKDCTKKIGDDFQSGLCDYCKKDHERYKSQIQ